MELSQQAAEMEKENMGKSIEKHKSLLRDKESTIEFLNFEASEKRKQLEEVSLAFETEKRYYNKYL